MTHKQTLLDQIDRRDAQVAVIGLGYVGLPLAVAFAAAGFRTFGIDVDARRSRPPVGSMPLVDTPESIWQRTSREVAP